MALFEHFPYTNFHELNLDELMTIVKATQDEVAKWTGDVTQAVADYIAAHPEIMITQNSVYTAAIQDQSVTLAKIDPQVGLDYVTPQMFKTSENTWRDAFQAALRQPKDIYVPTANGETYVIEGPEPVVTQGQTIPQPALEWPNDGPKRIYGSDTIWRTVGTSGAIVFRPVDDPSSYKQPFIQLTEGAHAVRISNLRFTRQAGYITGYNSQGVPTYATTAYAFDAAMDTSTQDKDVIINNCCFNDFYAGIEFAGRGLQVYSTTFSSGQYGIEISWPEAYPADVNLSRGIVIEGCRFHVNNVADIHVLSGHAHGMCVHGCYKDRRSSGGRAFIQADDKAQAWAWDISGNSLTGLYGSGSNVNTIVFAGGAVGCAITGNTFEGYPSDADGSLRGPFAAIACTGGEVNGLTVTGNSFYRLRRYCVNIEGCTSFKGLTFVGNTCRLEQSGSGYAAVRLGLNQDADEILVVGNRMDLSAPCSRVWVRTTAQPSPANLVVENNIATT